MNTIQSYKKNKKFSSIFKKAWNIGFSNPELCDNKAQMCFREIQRKCFKKKDVKLINLQLDFLDILPSIDSKRFNDIMYDQNCSYYTRKNNKYTCWETDLEEEIEKCRTKKKALCIMIDIVNYMWFEGAYATHSTILFIQKNGVVSYINSHGENMKDINVYKYKTKKSQRNKSLAFNAPLDVIFMEKFVNHYNRFCDKKHKIYFKNNKKHVYYGPCLQTADNHGVCFIFPIILWYFYEKEYNVASKMLKNGDIIKFVCHSIKNFHPLLSKIINSKNNFDDYDDVSDTLEELDYVFVKNVCGRTISFMTQKYFMNKL